MIVPIDDLQDMIGAWDPDRVVDALAEVEALRGQAPHVQVMDLDSDMARIDRKEVRIALAAHVRPVAEPVPMRIPEARAHPEDLEHESEYQGSVGKIGSAVLGECWPAKLPT